MWSPGTLGITESQEQSPSARINLTRSLTAASNAENISNNIQTSTPKSSVMKTILFIIELSESILPSNLTSSAQTKLNGCLIRIYLTQTRTHVSPPAPSQAQIVSHVPTHHISPAPSQGSVSILTLDVTATLSVKREKMRNCQCAMKNLLN